MSQQPPQAGGLVSNSFIAINQNLERLGINNSITLPQICVVGDQSSGKSSLVESISAIKVPRDSDCCTRCPLQINLLGTTTTKWKCDVSLIENYRFDKNPKLKRPTNNRPLGPWCKLETTRTTHFASTDDQDSVCKLIQQAQLAILNPSVDPTSYLGQGRSQEKLEVDFSPNIIRLEISGADTPNLSFIDLPGIIENTAERSNEYLIDLVKALVTRYVAQTHSINLLTLPMTTDIATSSSMRIVQKYDAEPRTMIVMTKPDMVNHDGHRKQFLKCLTNTATSMTSHMVRMQQDASIPLAESISMEEEYFRTSAWVPQQEDFTSKLGVPNLVNRLRLVLQDKTRDCLPSIDASIQQRLTAIALRLEHLPEPPDVQLLPTILSGLVQKLDERMKKLFLGGGNVDDFVLLSEWESHAQVFHQAIAAAWPRLTISTEADQKKMQETRATIAKNNGRTKVPQTAQSEGAQKISDDDDDVVGPTAKSEAKPLHSIEQQKLHASFTMPYIRKVNLKHATPGLPRQIFPMAIQEMQMLCLAEWHRPHGDFVSRTSELILKEVERHIRLVFQEYQLMAFVECAIDIVFTGLHDIFSDEKHILDMMLAVETTKPYTRDGIALERESKKALKEVLQKRQAYRIQLEQAVRDARNSSDVRGRTKDKVTEADLEEDDWTTEIEMLAKVRSYYYIASTRFVDNVCQSMSARMFTKYAQNLAAYLDRKLDPLNPRSKLAFLHTMTITADDLVKNTHSLRN